MLIILIIYANSELMENKEWDIEIRLIVLLMGLILIYP
jgi:hypothetical protein